MEAKRNLLNHDVFKRFSHSIINFFPFLQIPCDSSRQIIQHIRGVRLVMIKMDLVC